MSHKEKSETSSRPGETSGGMMHDKGLPGLRMFLALIITAGVIIGIALGMGRLENRVLQGQAGPVPVAVGLVLCQTPDWMPEELGKVIAKGLLPANANYNDPALAEQVHQSAAKNPWVSKVNVISKRMSSDPRIGELVVDAQFRQPIAKVRTIGDQLVFVDLSGVRLPDEQVPKYMVIVGDQAGSRKISCFMDKAHAPGDAQEIHYVEIQIENDMDGMPPEPGKKWDCAALLEGLKLVELISCRVWVNQIKFIDVRNYNGRINKKESFLRMIAQVEKSSPTEIKFGRFPAAGGDYEISPLRKMSYLDAYVADHNGMLAGKNQYLDLRYDELHVSIN